MAKSIHSANIYHTPEAGIVLDTRNTVTNKTNTILNLMMCARVYV